MMNTSSSCLINRLLALKSKMAICSSPELFNLSKELLDLADSAITALVDTELALDECLSFPEDFAFEVDKGIK